MFPWSQLELRIGFTISEFGHRKAMAAGFIGHSGEATPKKNPKPALFSWDDAESMDLIQMCGNSGKKSWQTHGIFESLPWGLSFAFLKERYQASGRLVVSDRSDRGWMEEFGQLFWVYYPLVN